MQIQSISGWRKHIRDGRRYLKTAVNGGDRPAVFTNELRFQLAAMAIEKLIVGVCQYHHRMPVDHTLSGLAADLAPVCPLDGALVERIRQIERIDDMCSLAPARRLPPDDTQIQGILEVGREVARFVSRSVPWEAEPIPSTIRTDSAPS